MKLNGKQVECIMCRHKSEQFLVVGSSSFGSMDLDTRPPENRRSAIKYSIQECPNCHYCHFDISEKPSGISLSDIKSDNYQKLIADESVNENAKKFILASYLYTSLHHHKIAASLYLQSAWIFDDLGEKNNAIKARIKTAMLIERYLEETVDFNFAVLLIDIYRRVGDFEKCIKTAQELLEYDVEDEMLNKIINHEITLARKCDSENHNISEVENL